MPTKIPAIGSSNWGNELNSIFNDTLVSKDWTKGVPGTDFAVDATAYIDPRSIMHSDVTFYVSTSGNDANDGLTAGTAFATPQKALMEATQVYQFTGHTITIQLAAGTYDITGGLTINESGKFIILQGDIANPASVVLQSNNFGLKLNTRCAIRGLTIHGLVEEISYNAIEARSTSVLIEDVTMKGFFQGYISLTSYTSFSGVITIDKPYSFASIIEGGSYLQATNGIYEGDKPFTINIIISETGNGIFVVRSSALITLGSIDIPYADSINISRAGSTRGGIGIVSGGGCQIQPAYITLNFENLATAIISSSASSFYANTGTPININNCNEGIRVVDTSDFYSDGTVEITNSDSGVICESNSSATFANVLNATVAGTALRTVRGSSLFVQTTTINANFGLEIVNNSSCTIGNGTFTISGPTGIFATDGGALTINSAAISMPTTASNAIYLVLNSIGRIYNTSISQGNTGLTADLGSSVDFTGNYFVGLNGEGVRILNSSSANINNSIISTSGQNGVVAYTTSTINITATTANAVSITAGATGIASVDGSLVVTNNVSNANVVATGQQLYASDDGLIKVLTGAFGSSGSTFTQVIGSVERPGFIYQNY